MSEYLMRPLLIARTMVPMTRDQNANLRKLLIDQVGSECLLIVIPSHIEIHNLGVGQSIPAGQVITERVVFVKEPRKSPLAAFVGLFRKPKEARYAQKSQPADGVFYTE